MIARQPRHGPQCGAATPQDLLTYQSHNLSDVYHSGFSDVDSEKNKRQNKFNKLIVKHIFCLLFLLLFVSSPQVSCSTVLFQLLFLIVFTFIPFYGLFSHKCQRNDTLQVFFN
jgi:hypothetical protein